MGSVSIVLPTRNNEDHIGELLTSIFSQKFEGELEVLILDSSDDRTPQIASKYLEKFNLRIVHVEPEEYNYGGTRNYGTSITSGEYIVFISTDVDIRDEFWLKKLTAPLGNPRVAGVFGGQLPKENAPPMEEFFIKYTYPKCRKEYYLEHNERISDFFFSNTNSAIKRDVWEKIPLPEMLMSEDQEWAKRAILSGYTIVYEPEAKVYHSHKYSLKQVFRRFFDSGATLPFVYNEKRIQPSNFFIRGFKYEYMQIKYIINNGYFKIIPYSLIYEFVKFLGYLMGTKYKYMPTSMRKLFSSNSNYWNKHSDIINLYELSNGFLVKEI